jgi:hypothetical protein
LGERFFVRAAPACCARLVAVRLPLHSQGTPEWLELAARGSGPAEQVDTARPHYGKMEAARPV